MAGEIINYLLWTNSKAIQIAESCDKDGIVGLNEEEVELFKQEATNELGEETVAELLGAKFTMNASKAPKKVSDNQLSNRLKEFAESYNRLEKNGKERKEITTNTINTVMNDLADLCKSLLLSGVDLGETGKQFSKYFSDDSSLEIPKLNESSGKDDEQKNGLIIDIDLNEGPSRKLPYNEYVRETIINILTDILTSVYDYGSKISGAFNNYNGTPTGLNIEPSYDEIDKFVNDATGKGVEAFVEDLVNAQPGERASLLKNFDDQIKKQKENMINAIKNDGKNRFLNVLKSANATLVEIQRFERRDMPTSEDIDYCFGKNPDKHTVGVFLDNLNTVGISDNKDNGAGSGSGKISKGGNLYIWKIIDGEKHYFTLNGKEVPENQVK